MEKIAAVQMCSSHLLDENLASAAHSISEARKNAACLVVLPENFALMGLKDTDKLGIKETFGHGKIQSFLSEQAKKNQLWIVGGTIPIQCQDENKVRASSLVFNDQGDLVARYDKIHLFDVSLSDKESYQESAAIEAGDQLVVVDTPFGKLGLAVCYDVRFPELFRNLFNRGAEIFILPSAFTVPTGEAHWEVLTRSRAIENFCYLIGACQGGTHSSGRKTYGHSIIVEPWGQVIAKREEGSGVIYADIDREKIYAARKRVPIGEHQKIFSISR